MKMVRLAPHTPPRTSYRKRVGTILGMFVVMLMSALLTSTTMAWISQKSVRGADDEGAWTDIAVDSSGMVHVAWQEYEGSDSPVFYNRGPIGDAEDSIEWEDPWQVDGAESKNLAGDESVAIAADNLGTIHMAILAGGEDVYYLYNDEGGSRSAWSRPERAPIGCDWGLSMTVDTEGNPYIACAEGLNDSDVFYTRRTSSGWVSSKRVKDSNGYMVTFTSIAVTGTGDDARVHIMFDYVDDEGDKPKVRYARGTTSGNFDTEKDFSDDLGVGDANQPFVAADPVSQRLYVAMVDIDDDGYPLRVSSSTNNGSRWSSSRKISTDWWSQAPKMYVADDVMHLVAAYLDGDEPTNSEIRYISLHPDNGFSGLDDISNDDNNKYPSIDGGGAGKAVSWRHDNVNGIRYNVDPGGGGSGGVPVATSTPTATPSPAVPPTITPTLPPTSTPTPIGPQGSLQVNNGDIATGTDGVFVALSVVSGKANQYKLWNDGSAEPASFTGMGRTVISPNSYVVQDWQLVSTGGNTGRYPCAVQKVFGRLNDTASGQSSGLLEDVVEVDPGVDVEVAVENPGQGSPNYTGTPFYTISVEDLGGECSGIQRVQMWEMEPEQSTSSIELSDISLNAEDPPGKMPLISQEPGDHTILVEVTDGVDNVRTYERVITLDTEQPTLAGDSGSMDIENATTGAVISGETTDTSEVDLQFSDISVTDNLYGTKETEERPFWGVCVFNSLETLTVTETRTFTSDVQGCKAIEVTDVNGSEDAYNFVVNSWNLVEGFDTNPSGGSTVYVYACVMDGANCSERVLLNEVTLDDNYSTPGTPSEDPTPTPVPPAPTLTPTPVPPPSGNLDVYLPLIQS